VSTLFHILFCHDALSHRAPRTNRVTDYGLKA
jgi:hypothetical protein